MDDFHFKNESHNQIEKALWSDGRSIREIPYSKQRVNNGQWESNKCIWGCKK